MRAVLLLAGLCALALASSVPKWQQQLLSGKTKYKISDRVVLKRQQDVLRLLHNVHQPNFFEDQVAIANTLNIQYIQHMYTNPNVVEEFMETYTQGMLPKGAIFSVYYEKHLQEAIQLFKMLYYAKDYNTFYKVASWARQNINEGMFIYTLSVAVVHRPDTSMLILPPIYEIYPQLFFSSDVMQKAEQVKQLYAGLTPNQIQQLLQIEQQGNWWQTSQILNSGVTPQQVKLQQVKLQQQQQQQGPYVQGLDIGGIEQILPGPGGVGQVQQVQVQQQILQQIQQQILQIEQQLHTQQQLLKQMKTSQGGQGGVTSEQIQLHKMKVQQLEQQLEKMSLQKIQIQQQIQQVQQQQVTRKNIGQDQVNEEEEEEILEEQMGLGQGIGGTPQVGSGLYGGSQQAGSGLYGGLGGSQQVGSGYAGSLGASHQHIGSGLAEILNPYQQASSYVDGSTPIFQAGLTGGINEDALFGEQTGSALGTQKLGLVISANYSSGYVSRNKEEILSYFTQDVGLNAFYYYFNIYYPFWMTSEELNLKSDRRGEQFYYIHQQILARYYLERVSNGLGKIPTLELNEPIHTGITPSLTYPNGVPLPQRPNNVWIKNPVGTQTEPDSNATDTLVSALDYETRIREAIDLGFVYTTHGKKVSLSDSVGIEILGNLIEGNPDSPNNRYYGALPILLRNLLGNSQNTLDQYKVVPSALEQIETSLRDPVFYQVYKKLVLYVQKYKKYLPQYNFKDLYVPGVTIQDVQVGRLITYFDSFDSDVTNGLALNPHQYVTDSVKISVRQPRLNHRPFIYNINVNSNKPVDVTVRVFIGPKNIGQDGQQMTLNQNRLHFVEIDKFVYPLKAGQNLIERNSRQSYWATDRTTVKQLYMRVMTAYNSALELQLDASETSWGIPNRLLLPKGAQGGQVFQLYVIVTPYAPSAKGQVSSQVPIGQKLSTYSAVNLDNYPLGFPFDRNIDESNFYVPNSYFKDIVIYHKSVEDIVRSQL